MQTQTSLDRSDTHSSASRYTNRMRLARRAVGGFYLAMSTIHIGVVARDPEIYRHFADRALVDFVRDRWGDVFMAQPAAWGLAVASGEIALGSTLLAGGRWARLGYAGVIGFHLALMLFGWGIWLWCVPALAVLVPLALREYKAARNF